MIDAGVVRYYDYRPFQGHLSGKPVGTAADQVTHERSRSKTFRSIFAPHHVVNLGLRARLCDDAPVAPALADARLFDHRPSRTRVPDPRPFRQTYRVESRESRVESPRRNSRL